MELKKALLERVAAHVLEDAALVLALPMAGRPPDPSAWDAQGVQLSFAGPMSGHCELWTTPQLMRLLAATMLGVPERDPEADGMGLEAMGETVNILCGSLLTELAGDEAVFQLGVPTPCERFAAPAHDTQLAESWFDVEGQPVCLRLWVIDPLSEAA